MPDILDVRFCPTVKIGDLTIELGEFPPAVDDYEDPSREAAMAFAVAHEIIWQLLNAGVDI